MKFRTRKLIVIVAVVAILLLAHIDVVVGWLDALGLIEMAAHVREHFLTGTAITVIVVIVFLLTPARRSMPRCGEIYRCSVCGTPCRDRAGYCSACGSHLRPVTGRRARA